MSKGTIFLAFFLASVIQPWSWAHHTKAVALVLGVVALFELARISGLFSRETRPRDAARAVFSGHDRIILGLGAACAFAAILSCLVNFDPTREPVPLAAVLMISALGSYGLFTLSWLLFRRLPETDGPVPWIAGTFIAVNVLGVFQVLAPGLAAPILGLTTGAGNATSGIISSVFPVSTTYGPLMSVLAVFYLERMLRNASTSCNRFLMGGTGFACMAGVLASGSRGALLGLMVGLGVLAWRASGRHRKLLCGLGLGLLVLFHATVLVNARFAHKAGLFLPYIHKFHYAVNGMPKFIEKDVANRIAMFQAKYQEADVELTKAYDRYSVVRATVPKGEEDGPVMARAMNLWAKAKAQDVVRKRWHGRVQAAEVELKQHRERYGLPLRAADFLPRSLGSATNRTKRWGIALDMWQAHPLLGLGLGQFNVLNTAMGQGAGWWVHNTHNVFLNILVEGGLLTFVPWLGLVFLFLARRWKGPLCATLAVILCISMFENLFDHSLSWVLTCAWILSQPKTSHSGTRNDQMS